MSKTLTQTLDEIVIWGGEAGEYEWTLGELEEGASWNIRKTIINYLETLKRPIPQKLVFGDSTPVKNADYNACIDELIIDIEEGKL